MNGGRGTGAAKGSSAGALDEKALGKRLQEARLAAGFTQQSLCQAAGLSYSTLTKIERGAIKAPSIFTIQTLALSLGTGLDELMGMAPVGAKTLQKKVSKGGVRFVYFDINGCLVRFFHQAFTKLAAETGAAPEAVESAFWHYNDDVCRGKMSMEMFNKEFAKRIGAKPFDWEEYYLDFVEPIQGTRELVEWAAQHYRVGLLSNIMPGFVTAMLAREILPNVQYDAVVDSSEVGAIKPEAKIFETATKAAGVKASEILLIDNERPNLMAASKSGWHALWFDDYRPDESIVRVRETLEPAE